MGYIVDIVKLNMNTTRLINKLIVARLAVVILLAITATNVVPHYIGRASAAAPITSSCYSGGPSDPSPKNIANLLCSCPATGCTGSAAGTPAGSSNIPAGCPGSSLAGPAAPGVCAAIPAGCPGSTLAGPASAACPGGVSTPDPIPDAPDPNAEFKGFGTKFVNSHKDDCTTISVTTCGIFQWVIIITNTLSAMVGIVVVASIIAGGIQYSTAGEDPQKIQAAKTRITNALIALFVSIFMVVFLNWVVPSGVI